MYTLQTVTWRNALARLQTTTFVTDQVTGTSMDGTWFGEAGFGCALGDMGAGRAWRFEVMLGGHGDRNITGTPGFYTRTVTVTEV